MLINYRMGTLRADLTFGIRYSDDLRKARQVLQELLAADPRVLAEPSPAVVIQELGDNAVVLAVRPWVNYPDYWSFQTDMLEKVKLRFDAEDIGFPFSQRERACVLSAGEHGNEGYRGRRDERRKRGSKREMTHTIKTAVLYLVRVLVLWVVDAISLALTAWLLPGMSITAAEGASAPLVAVSAAFLLAIINLLIRPVILLIARPLGWIAIFIVGFLVNAIAIWLTAWLLPGFNADLLSALVGGIVFGLFNAILTGILELDEEGSLFQNRIERRAKDQPFDSAGEPGRGLMMLEIDGLSYWVIQDALKQGLLPTLQQMIDEDGYALTKVDCGLPSMTSACQAGIMFGDNSDIPAYRWYDKSKGKLYVSSSDAAELNARYGHGQG